MKFKQIERLAHGGGWKLKLRMALIQWLAGDDITVLINVDHNHDRVSVNVFRSILVSHMRGALQLMPATPIGENLLYEANEQPSFRQAEARD